MKQNKGSLEIDYRQDVSGKRKQSYGNPDTLGRIRLQFTLTLGALLVQGTSVMIFMFSRTNSEREREVFIFAGIAIVGSAIILSLAYLMSALNQVSKSIQSINNIPKIDRSLGYIARWSSPTLNEARKKIAFLVQTAEENYPNSAKELEFIMERKFEEEPDLVQDLVLILNFLEEMAIGIKLGVLDEKLLKEFYRSIVISFSEKFGRFIFKRRKMTFNAKLYSSFENLSEVWRN